VLGASGFDWATFKDQLSGVTMDMTIDALDAGPVPAAAGILARFAAVEGLSGTPFGDILRGDHADALTLPQAGAQGSVLTNIAISDGLQEFLGVGVTSFGTGNIILGGDGSDIIEGRGGDDLIDGDAWLNVRISVRANIDSTGAEIDSYDSMAPLVPLMLNGTYNPGQLVIVREILPGNGGFDTAVFSDVMANYTITTDGDGVTTVSHLVAPSGGGNISDSTDRLTNIERLQFADQSVVLAAGQNAEPAGLLEISDTTPGVFQQFTVSDAGISDADGLGPISYVWQFEPNPGTGIFQDILTNTGVGVVRVTGPTFKVTPQVFGFALRVQGFYQDGNGVLETVVSAATDLVTAEPPTVAQAINDVTVDEDAVPTVIDLTPVFADADVPNGDVLTLTTVSDNPGVVFASVEGTQLTLTFLPNANGTANISVTATDLVGLTVTDTFTVTVNAVNDTPIVVQKLADLDVLVNAPAAVIDLTAVFTDVDIATNGDVLVLSAVSDNPGLVTTSLVGGQLTLTFATDVSGRANVTVTATDLAGESVSDVFAVTTGIDVVLAPGGLSSLVYTERDGSVVTVRFGGTTGSATVHIVGGVAVTARGARGMVQAPDGGDITSILLEGTTSRNSLSFTVSQRSGDGLATVGTITGNAVLGRLTAPKVDLTGEGIDLGPAGGILNLSVHDLLNGSDIVLSGNLGRPINIVTGLLDTGSGHCLRLGDPHTQRGPVDRLATVGTNRRHTDCPRRPHTRFGRRLRSPYRHWCPISVHGKVGRRGHD